MNNVYNHVLKEKANEFDAKISKHFESVADVNCNSAIAKNKKACEISCELLVKNAGFSSEIMEINIKKRKIK